MLKLNRVSKSFGKVEVLRNITVSVSAGQIIGLVGPSGAGKSVLLKIIGEVLEPDTGSIERPDDGTGVGFLFQEGALFDSMSVIDNVAFPLLSSDTGQGPVPHDEAMERSYEILKEVGLSQAYLKMPGQLSGGMRRRVGIARALVGRPKVVLLDDPTGGLDPVAASVIMNLVRALHEHYQPTIIMVSHDIRRLLPNVERVLALFHGRLICDEVPTDIPARAPEEVIRFLATRYDFPIEPSGDPSSTHDN